MLQSKETRASEAQAQEERMMMEARAQNLPPVSRVYNAISATTGKVLKEAVILVVDAKGRKVCKRAPRMRQINPTP